MIIKTEQELKAMREIGRICAITLRKMGEALQPGMTTKELDELGAEIFASYGAKSAPISCYNFPGHNCISVNEVVAHGIPGDYVIQPGDLVNIDVSAVKNGFFGDNSATFAVPPVKAVNQRLMECGQRALRAAIGAAIGGARLNTIGLMAEKEAHRHGYTTIQNLCGHGVGHTLHDEPDSIYNYYERRDRRIMQPGLVLAIEPFIAMGDTEVIDASDDGWTLVTPHRRQVVQYEHTVMVRDGQAPLILTTESEEEE